MDIEWLKKNISKKFVVTLLVGIATYDLARLGLLNAHIALVFTGLVGSYNWMQGRIDEKKLL